jgi:hypothetical protein
MRLHIVYRSTASENKAIRPGFYSKDLTLASFVQALLVASGLCGDVVFLNDGPELPRARLVAMERVGEVIELPSLGNSGSYRHALTNAVTRDWRTDDIVFFSEDDYLYLPSALQAVHSAAAGIPTASYFTPYDHPAYSGVPGDADIPDQREQRAFMRARRELRWTMGSVDWRAVRSTTMTFGARVGQLRKDLWIHFVGTQVAWPLDALIWDCVHSFPSSRGGIPAIFRGIDKRGRLPDRAKSALLAARDYVTAKDALLIAPTPSLATHLHVPYLAPNVDWATEAAAIPTLAAIIE